MKSSEIHIGDCTYCKESGELCVDHEITHLQPLIAKVFVLLVENRGDIVTREELFDGVWPHQTVSDESLTRCISVLRKILHQHDSGLEIETMHKRGYRLNVLHESAAEGFLPETLRAWLKNFLG